MFSRIFFPFLMIAVIVSSTSLSAQDDRLQLVASHSILSDVVRHVAGDQADLTLLMPIGADPHSFQPSPRDLTAVAEADLVFVNGARFEESLLEDVENAAGDGRIIEVSACVEIIASGSAAHDEHDEHDEHGDEHDEEGEHDEADDHDEEGEHDDHDEADDHDEDDEHDEADEHDDEHDEADDHDDEHDEMEASGHCDDHDSELAAFSDDDHSHDDMDALGRLEQIDCGGGHSEDDEDDEHDEEDEHAHSHGVCDPHVWMNPRNVMHWTLMIRDSLAEADPANAEAYRANAAAYLNQLHDLSHDFIEPALEDLPQSKRVLITSHDSLGYLAARYDFDIIGTVGGSVSTLSEPSARRVAELIDLIQTDGIPAIFGETTANEDVMEMIAGETGAALITLYSGTLSDGDGPAATYLDYMRYNLGAVIGALQDTD